MTEGGVVVQRRCGELTFGRVVDVVPARNQVDQVRLHSELCADRLSEFERGPLSVHLHRLRRPHQCAHLHHYHRSLFACLFFGQSNPVSESVEVRTQVVRITNRGMGGQGWVRLKSGNAATNTPATTCTPAPAPALQARRAKRALPHSK